MGTHVTTVVHLSDWELTRIEANKEVLLKSMLPLASDILNLPYYYPPLATQLLVATTTTNSLHVYTYLILIANILLSPFYR